MTTWADFHHQAPELGALADELFGRTGTRSTATSALGMMWQSKKALDLRFGDGRQVIRRWRPSGPELPVEDKESS